MTNTVWLDLRKSKTVAGGLSDQTVLTKTRRKGWMTFLKLFSATPRLSVDRQRGNSRLFSPLSPAAITEALVNGVSDNLLLTFDCGSQADHESVAGCVVLVCLCWSVCARHVVLMCMCLSVCAGCVLLVCLD